MSSNLPIKLLAWAIALTLVALPFVGVLINAEQIRAATQPLLGKGFFAIDLDAVRTAVAALPWVEHAEARKRWPDTIELVIYERQPYARWGADRLVSRSGELFTVAGAEGLHGLPQMGGPDDRLGDVLQFYADCVKEFSGSGLVIDAVTLSSRGGWKVDLASGAIVEIGRDNAKAHLSRFLDVWPSLVGAHPEPPAYIDLRYENGFSMRWQAPAPVVPVIPATGNAPPATSKPATAALLFSTPTPDSRPPTLTI